MKHKALGLSFLLLALSACSRSSDHPAAQAASNDSSCGPAPTSEAEEALANQKQLSAEAQQSAKTPSSNSKTNNQDNIGEVVWVLSWHLCNARSNGWVDDNFYRTQFIAMRDQSFAQLGVEVPKPAAASDETNEPPQAP